MPTNRPNKFLKIFEETLGKAGGSFENVVRTRMYLTNIKDAEAVCKAHGEVFHTIRPASCLIEVKGLILPEMLVEMECDAIITY